MSSPNGFRPLAGKPSARKAMPAGFDYSFAGITLSVYGALSLPFFVLAPSSDLKIKIEDPAGIVTSSLTRTDARDFAVGDLGVNKPVVNKDFVFVASACGAALACCATAGRGICRVLLWVCVV